MYSSAFEELHGVTKNASGFRHNFLSRSFTLHSESVSKAFNQIDLFHLCSFFFVCFVLCVGFVFFLFLH